MASRVKSPPRPATRLEILERNLKASPGAKPATLAGGSIVEQGATGTPNVGGYIIGEEYNPKLEGKAGIAVYDEMRRSSAQVQASLAVVKVPILSAKPTCTPPKNGDNTDRAIADACARMLFGDERAWKTTLSHLLLRLEFGVSALEKVWVLDPAFPVADKRQAVIRPQRLAPRLPHTYERFLPDENGQLKTLEQYALKNGQYQRLSVPASDLIVTVHQQEGDNYWGRSVLRTSYMHWFYMTQAYRIGAVRLDRYGVGIPVAELEEKHKATVKELDKIEKLLKAMRVHERAYFMLPFGVKVRILVPEGGKGGVDELPAVEHHSGMIARNVLAGFILTESSDGIGANRTATLKDFFSSALESVAGDLAGDLQAQLIVPFCNMNFPMQGREYPSLAFADLNDVDTTELATNLNVLSTGDFVTPDDGIEEILRKVMKLPPMTEEQKGRTRSRATSPGTPTPVDDPSGNAGAPGGRGKKPATAKGGAKPAVPGKKNARQLSLKYTDPLTQRVYGREPNAEEQAYFALREVPDRLELETHDLIAALSAIRVEQLEKAAATIAKKDARNTADFTDLRPAQITVSGAGALERAIRASQTRVAAYGAFQVRQELQRQGAPAGTALRARESYWTDDRYDGQRVELVGRAITLADPRVGPIDPTAGASAAAARSSLVTSAKITAEKLVDWWKARILETGLRLRRTGLRGPALEAAILAELRDAIPASVKADATGEINEAFGLGRATEASARSDEIQDVLYSALMDVNTCDPCAALDGEVMAYDSPRYWQTMPPYSGCEGNKGKPDACRCVHLFRYKPVPPA